MMGDFAIVAEGYTDQVVIKNVLLGLFEGHAEEPFVNFEQPLLDETSQRPLHEHGGWDLVLKYLQQGKYLQALQLNRYLVVHIDTDVSEQYGVAKHQHGVDRTAQELIEATVSMLRSHISAQIVQQHGDRFLFAIAVHSIECWLLPLVFDRSQPAKQAKLVGCLPAIDEERRKSNLAPLSSPNSKNPDVYRAISRGYRKRKVLLDNRSANLSLALFIDEVVRHDIAIPAADA